MLAWKRRVVFMYWNTRNEGPRCSAKRKMSGLIKKVQKQGSGQNQVSVRMKTNKKRQNLRNQTKLCLIQTHKGFIYPQGRKAGRGGASSNFFIYNGEQFNV